MVPTAELAVEIVVTGRNVEIPEHYRQHVQEKLARLERYDHKLSRLEVELFHEPNRRQADKCQRVEITGRSRGPAIRAEAAAKDFYVALDIALEKLENRLRRSADRRRVHHGRRTPMSVAAATASLGEDFLDSANNLIPTQQRVADPQLDLGRYSTQLSAEEYDHPIFDEEYQPGLVRKKEHIAKPMTIDQALYEMELVGHDFYLFQDVDSGRPSVVYRRRGYNYGLICLV